MVAPRRRDAAIEHLDFAIAEFQDMETQPALERALGRKGLLESVEVLFSYRQGGREQDKESPFGR